MSIIQPGSIKAIAHSVDIPKLSDEAAKTLAPDVEYRLREVVQEALKFAKHAKRTKLTTEDINNALRLRNVEPVYGFNSKDPAKFLRVAPHSELMYVQDPEVTFNQLIEAALPKVPRDAGVTAHWLAINGVQPDIPENISAVPLPAKRRQILGLPGPGGSLAGRGGLQDAAVAAAGLDAAAMADPATAAAAAAAAARSGSAAVGQQQQHLLPSAAGQGGVGVSPRTVANAAVQLQLPLRHDVSRELQVYFDRVVGLILAPPPPPSLPLSAAGAGAGSSSAPTAAAAAGDALLTGALSSVASDPGLHPLMPYFCAFIADGVKQHLGNLVVLHRLLLLTRALLANPGVHVAPYLQQLLPAVVTCVVTKTLGGQASEDHWAVRRQAASLLSSIAAQFAAPHHNLQPQLCRVLAQAWLDADKPFTSKYGAVVGLQALGPQVVRTLLIPHLEPFMSAVLIPAMCATAEPAAGGSLGDGVDDLQQQQQQQLPRRSLQRQQQEQQQKEAWQVYDALLSAVGGATYDLLIGHLRGKLPVHLLLPRSGAGQGSSSWQAEYTTTLLAAKRHKQLQQQQQGGQPDQADGGADAAGVSAMQVDQQQQQGPGGQTSGTPASTAAAASGLRGPPGLRVRSQQSARGAGAAAVGAGSSGSGGASPQQPSVAEVLGRSWKEDSDVNATLGALLELFGEDLLPSLPQPELAATSL